MKITAQDRIGMVWSGGGARGAYQMGVWKALRELGIEQQVSVLTGTSIGAMNGVAFVQGDYETSMGIWEQMDYNKVFDSIPKKEEITKTRLIYSIAKDLVRKRGLSVDISRERVKQLTKEAVVRASKIDFGLVVYNWTKRQGEKLFVEEIPEGLLADYINASSNIPVFQSLYINGDKYVDGGLSEVVPLSLCMKRAHKFNKLIIVHINSFGYHSLEELAQYTAKEVLLLSPMQRIGSAADFSNATVLHSIEQGYQDSMATLQVEVAVSET